MLKNSKVKYFLLLVVTVLICLAPLAFAQAQEGALIEESINKAAGDLIIPAGTTVNGDVVLNLGELVVEGIVTGSVSNNMGQVVVSGDVTGDVESNMGQVVISGNVGGKVKTRLGEIVISGAVGGDVHSDLGEVNINGTVGGNVYSGFGEIKVPGLVLGNVGGNSGQVSVEGTIEGDLNLERGLIMLGPEAVVRGSVTVGQGRIEKAEGAVTGLLEVGEEKALDEIEGLKDTEESLDFKGLVDSEDFVDSVSAKVAEELSKNFNHKDYFSHFKDRVKFSPSFFTGYYNTVTSGLIGILIMYALAALTYTLFPKHVERGSRAVTLKPGLSLGWGTVALILALPLMFVLILTIIGIPLILVELALFAAAGILGYTSIAYLLGGRIIETTAKAQANPFVAMAVGVLILGFARLVPFAGFVITVAVYVLAVGAALVTYFGTKEFS